MKVVPIRDVVSVIGGGTPRKSVTEYYGGSIPWVTPKDMKSPIISGSQVTLTELGLQNSPAKLVPPSSTLVVVRSGVLKHTLPVALTEVPVALNQDMKALVPQEHVHGPWLSRLVKSLQLTVLSWVRATTADNFPIDNLLDLEVELPPLEEQRRIAAILDEVSALLRVRNQTLVHLDALAGSIFTEMFGSHQHEYADLSEVVRPGTLVTYGIVQAGPEFDGGVPYIKTGDIVNGVIQSHALRHTDPAIAAKFERSRVGVGDIVMSIRATVGTTALVPPELDGANLTQGTAKISPSDVAIGPYLLHYLRSPAAQRWIQTQVKGATFREITLGALRQLPVPLAPIALQREFDRRLQRHSALRVRASTSGEHLNALFASLQSGAFAGRL